MLSYLEENFIVEIHWKSGFSTFGRGPFTNTCKGGLTQRGWTLKIFDPCKGALKKITTNFPVKIQFTCFSMGLTRNFHGKRGALIFFFAVWMGAPKNFRDKHFLHQPPPLQVFVNGP